MLSEFASADQVEVNMHHGLSGSGAAVVDDAVAVFQPLSLGNLRDGGEAGRDSAGVRVIEFVGGSNVLLRHDEDMHRGLGIDIPEGEDLVVLIDLAAGDLPGDNLAKQAIVHGNAPFK